MEKNKNIKQLLQKFLNDDCSQLEADQIVKYFRESKQTDDFPTVEHVLDLFHELPMIDDKTSNIIIGNILKGSKPRYHIWRYAVAAVLVIALASTYFLRNQIFGSSIEPTTPIIVNNRIVPGTDKATLTLETGEIVALEKGTTYQTKNATSNGEEITYINSTSHELVYNYLTIPRGGQFQMTLSDGTRVWLNSESQLKYPVSFTDGESRKVELVYGEAYFEVSHSTEHKGSHFKVLNNNQEVEVLGTQFNIKAYKEDNTIYTTLVKGSVVIHAEGTDKVLKPGEQSNVDINTKNIQVNQVDVFRAIAWKDGIFSFKNKSLKEIMAALSRWYDMDVVFENKELEKVNFNGTLYKTQSIQDILNFLQNSINTYEINNKTIILK